MDPAILNTLIGAGSKLLAPALANGGMPAPPPQRADGYAMGGMLDGRTSRASTSGAYGGAFSQANVDGSNWTVSTGRSSAIGGGTSGGNGGLTPTMTNSQGTAKPLSLLSDPGMFSGGGGGGNGLMLVGLAVLAYLIVKR